MSSIVPKTCSGASFSPSTSTFKQVRRQIVAGIGHVVLDLPRDVLLDRRELLDALLFGVVHALEDDVDKLEEESSSSFGNPSMRWITPAG